MNVAVKQVLEFDLALVEQLAYAVLHEDARRHDANLMFRSTPNPFPGLRYYTSDISEVFVGRDEQIIQILRSLGQSQTVLVLGGSGCGKSSLVRGGVLARLTGTQPVPGRHGAWYPISWRPERRPCAQLADAFWQDFAGVAFKKLLSYRDGLQEEIDGEGGKDASSEGAWRKIADPRQASEALIAAMPAEFQDAVRSAKDAADLRDLVHEELRRVLAPGESPAHNGLARLRLMVESFDRAMSGDREAPGANVLFVVDQFEEVFRDEVDPVERRTLMALIRYVYELKPPGVYLALVMRSEDLHRCAEEPHLPDIVNTSSMFVDWLDRAQLRQVIIEPACRVFRSWLKQPRVSDDEISPFAAELVEALLDEADLLKRQLKHKGDHLPLLQHGLRILWQEAARHWQEATGRLVKGMPVEPEDLRIDLKMFADMAEKARSRTIKRNADELEKSTPHQSTNLQWLLSDAAEETLASAVSLFDTQTLSIAPISFFQAAFCELASLDENRRYYRKFRTVTEVIDLRLAETNRSANLEKLLSAGLDKFRAPGLLTHMGSGAWDVTHEALIRNWTRVRDWVARDVAIRNVLRRSFSHGTINNWNDARVLQPVLGYPRSPVHSFAWARSVATGSSAKGSDLAEAEFRATWWKLQGSYLLERCRKMLMVVAVCAVLLFGGALFYSNAKRIEVQTRYALMSAYAIALNASSEDNSSTTTARAIELWNAVRILRTARPLVESQLKKDATVAKELSLASTTVDKALRLLLGRTLVIRDVRDGDVRNSESEVRCDGGAEASAESMPMVASATGKRAVRLSAATNRQRSLSLQSSSGATGWMVDVKFLPSELSTGVSDDMRICLSGDGQVLTITTFLEPFPRVYDLGWYSLEKAPAAVPIQIQNRGSDELNLGFGQRSFATKVTGISPPDRQTGARQIWFETTLPDQTPRKLIAGYFEGYSAPQRDLSAGISGQLCVSLPPENKNDSPTCRFSLGAGWFLVSSMLSSTTYADTIFPSTMIRLYETDGELITASDRSKDAPLAVVTFNTPAPQGVAVKFDKQQRLLDLEDTEQQRWQLRMPSEQTEATMMALKSIIGPIDKSKSKDWLWSEVCLSKKCNFEGLVAGEPAAEFPR